MKLNIKHSGKILFGITVYFLYANFMYFAHNIPSDSPYAFLRIFAYRFFEPFVREGYFRFIVKTMFLGFLLGMPGLLLVNIIGVLFSSKKKP
jgi:hypothetical protein